MPVFLGLRAVIATAFARIHGQNRVNFGVTPLLFRDQADHDTIELGDVLSIEGLHAALHERRPIEVVNTTRDRCFHVRHDLSDPPGPHRARRRAHQRLSQARHQG